MATWDGRFYNLTISAKAYPELHEELANIPPKERGARLKSLALLGLSCMRQFTAPGNSETNPLNSGIINGDSHGAVTGMNMSAAGDPNAAQKDDLKKRLIGSLPGR